MAAKPEKPWWQPAMTVFAEATGWIVAPIVGALFLGKYLDEKNDSEPWFFLGLTAIAFVISCTGIVILAAKYLRQIEQERRSDRPKPTYEQSQYRGNRRNGSPDRPGR